jgi:hypothetical protein
MLGLCSAAAVSQLTIDATSLPRPSTRRITAGHVGSIGRKLPLEISLKLRIPSTDPSKPSEVEFILTNVGKERIRIPISPNLGDFEPSDPRESFKVMHLSLFMTAGEDQKGRLSGGADLYGSSDTVAMLDPAQAIHVLTRVVVPLRSSQGRGDPPTFVAHAILNDETVKPSGDGMVLNAQEIGSAISRVYVATSLDKSDE